MVARGLIALVLTTAGAAPGKAVRTSLDQRTRRSDTQLYFSFIIHCDDFSNPMRSAAAVRRLLDMLDARRLPAELVVSVPVAEAWQATSHDLIERLRRGTHAISYVCRAPHPVCFPGAPNRRLAAMPRAQRLDVIRRLETHGWDPTSGEPNQTGTGGYRLVKETFGQTPWAVAANATSDALRDDHLAVLRELGARVVSLDPAPATPARSPLCWRGGMLVRPCDMDLTTIGGPRARRRRRHDRGLYWWNHAGQDLLGRPTYRLRQYLQRAVPERVYFGLVGIHDYDTYSLTVPWWRIYYERWHSLKPLKPPFAITPMRGRRMFRERDKATEQAIWRAYEEIVTTVARNAQIRVVTSREWMSLVAGPPDDAPDRLVPARIVLPPHDTWPQPVATDIPAEPRGRLLAGLFLQAPPNRAFVTDASYFRAKARVCEELADMCKRHGARLTVQADVELALGAEAFDPGLIRRLHDRYAVEFSLRTALRQEPGTELEQFLGELRTRKEKFEAMGSGPITDLCGGFDLEDPWVLAPLGFRTQSAMRNPFTGRSCGRFYVHPWRVSKASPLTDEVRWARADPESPIVFLPGQGTFGPRSARTLRERVYPSLVRALNAAQVARANTWYGLTHVDSFRSTEGRSLTDYMASPEHQRHLQVYDKTLTELFDPLVQKKYVRWATPSEMHKAAIWWDRHRF